MRCNLTADDIANNARMLRAGHPGSIVIVEGDTDLRVYKRFVNDNNCKFIIAYGKENAITSLTKLELSNFAGIFAIIDSDFWALDGIKSHSKNLLLTDSHDLETMILSSPALDKVLSEFGSLHKIRKLSKPVDTLLLHCCIPLGFFRWLSSPTKLNLCLNFKNLSFKSFIDTNTFVINIKQLISHVENNSMQIRLPKKKVREKIKKLMRTNNYDPWHICNGHDLIELLTIGLRYIFGNSRSKGLVSNQVDAMLRVAYEYSFFRFTSLFNSIKQWEKNNSGFIILN